MDDISKLKISIREMTEDELPLKVKWANDIDVNRYVGFDHEITITETKKWFRKQLCDPNIKLFTIFYKKNAIGYLKLVKNERYDNGELQITIGEKQHWGKGYGKVALIQFLKYCFYNEGLNKVYVYVYEWNKRAINLYTECHFAIEGRLRKHQKYFDGKYYDMLIMGIIKNEFDKIEYNK